MADVRPVTEFRVHTSAVLAQVKATKRPIVLTREVRTWRRNSMLAWRSLTRPSKRASGSTLWSETGLVAAR